MLLVNVNILMQIRNTIFFVRGMLMRVNVYNEVRIASTPHIIFYD